MTVSIRTAVVSDLDTIIHFIRALADYERLSNEVRLDPNVLREHLFGARPMAEVLLAERDGQPIGFALFFHNFSTFEGRPGLYLEDLFVVPEARGSGAGKALLQALARIALERTAPASNGGCSTGIPRRSPSTRGSARRRWTIGRFTASTARHSRRWRNDEPADAARA